MAIVSIKAQQVTFYDAEGWILRAPVSTGVTERETPAGVFAVLEKDGQLACAGAAEIGVGGTSRTYRRWPRVIRRRDLFLRPQFAHQSSPSFGVTSTLSMRRVAPSVAAASTISRFG